MYVCFSLTPLDWPILSKRDLIYNKTGTKFFDDRWQYFVVVSTVARSMWSVEQSLIDPSIHWDHSAHNRSHCHSMSLREIISFQIFSSVSWVWSTSIVRLRILYCSIIGLAIDAFVCARSSPAECSFTCSYHLPCRGDRRKFSWKLIRKDWV